MKYSEIEKMKEEINSETVDDSKDDPIEGTAEAFSQPLDYNCDAWSVDASKFIPPIDVEFTDATKALEELKNGAKNMMQGMCDSCNNLPETAKAECLKNCRQGQPE